jgi:hypothetical protein
MTETPKTKLDINPDKINYSRGYKLNPNKLKEAPQSILPFVCGAFYYTEDYEYFELIKPYLDIPEPRKSLEEIKQELDEKFEKLIETTKWKFAYSKEGAEKRYNTKFDKIFDNFEYAKRNGYFLQYLSFTTSGNASIGNGIVPNSYLAVSGSLNTTITSNFVIKPNGNDVGYWEIQPNIQVYRKTKPNRIVRYFTKLLLDFTWKDV